MTDMTYIHPGTRVRQCQKFFLKVLDKWVNKLIYGLFPFLLQSMVSAENGKCKHLQVA